ncbi:hypothetical protein CBR_g50255 [Chara braunii]|uniref:CCHC-type domain-containing protein n=1 Tax=Chara braunii TaxID=69332 RepID=A0A388M6I2_CHABU|nr:hypothetical protein CBR_g50255 [Chara braunii]|eukprot:GBG90161.1 hypothetical protein CBR_g50255 [Chara braunii]
MYLTNGSGGGGNTGYGGSGNGPGNEFSHQGNQDGSGGAFANGNNVVVGSGGVCYNCGKPGHIARDCWSKRGRPYQQSFNQPDPELEEIKEHHRQLRRERQELEERRRAEEEKKTKEEEEQRRNLDFARKMEELRLQLRMDLNEEWRRREQEATAAVRNTKGAKNKEPSAGRNRKSRKNKWNGKMSKRGQYSDSSEGSESESESGWDSTVSISTSDEEGSRGRSRRKKEKGKKRGAKKKVGKQKNRKKAVSLVDLTSRFEHGECSKHRTAGPDRTQGEQRQNEEDRDEREEELKTPLTGGYKGLSAGCSQKGLIEYCISAHKIYSGKSAPDLRKLCDKKGIRYTRKPEVVELLTRQQVELAYEGFDEKEEEESADGKGKGKAPATPKTEVRKDRIVQEQTAGRQPHVDKREISRRRKVRRGRRERNGRSTQTRVKDTVAGCYQGVSFASVYSWLDTRSGMGGLHETVTFNKGEVWIDGWRAIKRKFGETRLLIDNRRVLLKNAKERLQQGGTVVFRRIVKMKTTTEKNKQMLVLLLKRQRPVAQLANLTTNKLIGLYRAAGCFTEKKTKLAIHWRVDSAIRRKVGTGVRRKVIVKLRFDSCIWKRGIRRMTEQVIDYKVRDQAVAGFMKTRIRVIWMRNKTVGQLLHNQKTFAVEEQFPCKCNVLNLPKVEGHVATRFADLEDVPTFLRNSRNVTRASTTLKENTLIQAVLNGTKRIRGPAPTIMVPEGTIDVGRRASLAWTDLEVRRWGKNLRGLVLVLVDRNQGDTAVFCPILYRHAFGKTFLWNTNYHEVCPIELEADFLARCKKDFMEAGLHVFGPWRAGGRLGTAYVIPKHKDLGRWRPIAPSPSDPAPVTLKRITRALHYLLLRLPARGSFYLNSVADLREGLESATRSLDVAGCSHVVGRCYDIKEMFSRIPHEAVIQAVEQPLCMFENNGWKSMKVTYRAKTCVISNSKKKSDGYVSFTLQDLLRGVRFNLEHSVIRCGRKIMK